MPDEPQEETSGNKTGGNEPEGLNFKDFLGHKGWAEIIKGITGWFQVLSLIILVVESILIFVLYKSAQDDPKKIWYIVAALAFFLVFVVAMVFDRYTERREITRKEVVLNSLKKEIDRKEVGVQNALDSLAKLLSERYGVVAKLLHVKVEINPDGSTKITRSWKGVCVVTDYPIPYLPGKISADNPGVGAVTSPARLVSYNIGSKKALRVRDFKKDGNFTTFKFEIVGQFYKQDGELDYIYESEASKMFQMDKESVEKAYADSEFPYELMACTPDLVVEELQIEICYPPNFIVSPLPGVFYGQTEIMHNRELTRVKFDYNNQRAVYTIKAPILGLVYLVFWMPPPAKQTS
jgi:hypothetical protein